MPLPLKTGEVLRGRYRIRERIGQGGMGNIYLADDLRLQGRRCALKEVEHDRTLPARILKETREQFMREATVLARLDHPNLPKVSDFFTVGPRDYLVMDFVPGKDLRTLIHEARQKRRFLPEADVLGWAAQVCDALSYLHHQTPPIVHRDIKPGNLKLTPGGLIKLVDFGLVKLLLPDEMTVTVIQGQGTALYTPLEQYGADAGHTDVRSDLYAFGATLYHLLTCEPPPDARQRFLDPGLTLSLRQINPAIHPRTEKAVLWAMSLRPDERPESVEVLREALLGGRDVSSHAVRAPRAGDWRRLLFELPEAALIWPAAGLLLISLIASLAR